MECCEISVQGLNDCRIKGSYKFPAMKSNQKGLKKCCSRWENTRGAASDLLASKVFLFFISSKIIVTNKQIDNVVTPVKDKIECFVV